MQILNQIIPGVINKIGQNNRAQVCALTYKTQGEIYESKF